MSQIWRSTPAFKVECSGQTYINDQALEIEVFRPENNISYATLVINDEYSEKYVDVFDPFDTLDISLRYGSGTYTKVFSGTVSTCEPTLSNEGEVLGVAAWGKGIPIAKTHCNTSYGLESKNPTLNTAKEIIEDILDNYVEKTFGGAASGWTVISKVDDVYNTFDLNHLNSQYLDNFTMINKVCDLVNAFADNIASPRVDPGIHWYVDTSGNCAVKEIDQNHSDGGGYWDRYWGGTEATAPGTQASSKIQVTKDMIRYDFRKYVEEYANNIILFSKLRKPGWDMWTEYRGAGADTGSALWGTSDAAVTDENGAGLFKVGSYSVRIEGNNNPAVGLAYYPSTLDLNLNCEKISSQDTPAFLEFYMRGNHTDCYGYQFRICSGGIINDNYMTYQVDAWHTIPADIWVHVKVPLGPYHHEDFKHMTEVTNPGDMDWTDVDGVCFSITDTQFAGPTQYYTYIDDLHFTGLVCREAKDASEITANNEYQKVMRMDTAVDDSVLSGTPGTTDKGTAARLAHSELLRRSMTPVVGKISIPLAPTLLPGQTVYINAGLKKGYNAEDTAANAFRINSDMRVKDLTHLINKGGFATVLNLTDDVYDSHAFAVPTQADLLYTYAGALGHSEALNLKGGGIDNLIPRLSESY